MTQKLLDLHQSGKLPKKAVVRQGASNTWTPASEIIESLQQKQSLLAQLNQTIAAESKPSLRSDGEVDVIKNDVHRMVEDDELEVIDDDELEVIEDGEAVDIPMNVANPIPSRLQLSKPVPIVRPIAIAQVVAPAPSLFSTSGDPFRGIPSVQPVAMPAVPTMPAVNTVSHYSTPIITPANPILRTRPANPYTPDQEAQFWQWFYWMIGLALVPRIILLALAGLAYHFQSGVGMICVGGLAGLEYLALLAVGVALGIWGIVIAFRESTEQGLLYLFIPFYLFYYFVSRWERCWPVVMLHGGYMLWSLSFIGVPLLVALVLAPRLNIHRLYIRKKKPRPVNWTRLLS